MAPPALVCLPTADRATSFAFYRDGLGLTAFGPVADDGVPEPLLFVVNDGLHLMFIPTGGFGWVTGDHAVAARGTSECLISLSVATTDEVDRAFERAVAAGATAVQPPVQQPWGYLATFADPDAHLWQITVAP
jgi:predicted lactoylglutathione lyase